MSQQKIVVLDGTGVKDKDLTPIVDVLRQVLGASGAEVQVFPLREMKLAHCLGCFTCWIKTPGICVEADAGRDIARAVIRSDVAVFLTPVTFGGYSPELKKIEERFIQLLSPFFQMEHGEMHHPPRYEHRPRLMMVGVQRHANPAEAQIFKTLAGRNAINFHPPSYAAEVVQSSDNLVTLQNCFEALLTRCDALPFGDTVASLMPAPVRLDTQVKLDHTRRALLIVGSPKTNEPSTSAAIGGFLVKRIADRGWETETLTLRPRLSLPEGEAELVAAVERSGLILLVFPLYADALPYLVTKALTVIAAHRREGHVTSPQRLTAIVNSGFPETHQNALALSICREFAEQSGFSWAGGLAFGGGGMIGGEPLTAAKRSGPPIRHVIEALDMSAACLADGLPVPAEAMGRIMKRHMPSAIFNRFYMWMGGRGFAKLAAKNGVTKEQLLARPYAAA